MAGLLMIPIQGNSLSYFFLTGWTQRQPGHQAFFLTRQLTKPEGPHKLFLPHPALSLRWGKRAKAKEEWK